MLSEFKKTFGENVKINEPLAPYLAYQVGGPADFLVFPKTEEHLTAIQTLSQKWNLPITLVGRGTNLLVRDGGIRGIVVNLLNGFDGIEILSEKDERTLVLAQGGVQKQNFLNWSIQNSLTGLEFSSGVPGTIGGGIFMNAGTKYGCYGDILTELRLFDFKTGFRNLDRSECHFGYREQNAVKNSIVIHAVFELKKGNAQAIEQEVNRIIKEREEKQPLDYPSCGSTFKNPEGHSAGRLIEKAELKGLTQGGAEISMKHANFFLNKNNAKASDILKLIAITKETVKNKFNIDLECEVVILGEDL